MNKQAIQILRSKQKEMLVTKNTLRKMKKVSHGLFATMDTAEERIYSLENIEILPPKLKSE